MLQANSRKFLHLLEQLHPLPGRHLGEVGVEDDSEHCHWVLVHADKGLHTVGLGGHPLCGLCGQLNGVVVRILLWVHLDGEDVRVRCDLVPTGDGHGDVVDTLVCL